jgi:Protein of unknown function (DUF3999)
MRIIFVALALIVAVGTSSTSEPSISYFTNVRDIRLSQAASQNYFVVDEEIWNHARRDLGDLRIYDGESQVQYALMEERGGMSSREESARILNLGSVGGHTEFDLDVSNLEAGQIGEYDRVRLQLDAKDFVVTASVAGSNQLAANPATQLPPSTLYDFSHEELGSNLVLKLPPSTFRYLHVKLSGGISPTQVKGVSVYNLLEAKAVWTTVGSCGVPAQVARTTVITCNAPSQVPVDRVRFGVDAKQVNFRRPVTLADASNSHYETTGEVSRVRMNRGGAAIVSEEMDVPVTGQSSGRVKVTVDNGDNPPLAISSVQLLSVERRVYFDPQGKSLLKLYYGDSKLESPVYDYSRFFKPDPAAAREELGPGSHNEAYRGRPDDRPWSERHKALLWLAMLLAVILLAGLAIRGLRTKALLS